MAADWQQKERTLPFFLHITSWIVQNLGRSVGRLLLPFIIGYYLLFARTAKQHSRQYLRRVLPLEHGKIRFRDIFRHFHAFGAVTLDRLVLLSGGLNKLEVTVSGPDSLYEYQKSGQGCLLLVSHVGSFEALRVVGNEQDKLPIKILMNKSVSGRMLQVIDALNPEMANAIIDVSERGPQVIFDVQNALNNGNMVGVMADRCFSPNEATIDVPFLGGTAAFPQSPWLLAAATKVPVIVCFGWYLGGNRYHVEFQELTNSLTADRRDRSGSLQRACQQYANTLEQGLRKHPLNWFNFFDFWKRQ